MKTVFSAASQISRSAIVALCVIGTMAAFAQWIQPANAQEDNEYSSVEKSGRNATDPVEMEFAELHEDFEVWGLDFSPDGNYLAATAVSMTVNSREVHIWDWRQKKIVRVLEKPVGSVDSTVTDPVKYSPDGRFLAACHSRGNAQHTVIRVWNAATGEILNDIEETIGGGGGCKAIGFTPDSKFLIRILGGGPKFLGNTLAIYRTETWLPVWGLRTVPFYPDVLDISADGKYAVVGGNAFDPETLKPHREYFPHKPQIWVIDLIKREIVRTIDAFPLDAEVSRVSWNSEGTYIAAGGRVGGSFRGTEAVKIFNWSTGQLVTSEPAKIAGVHALKYSPDARYLIESGIDRSIRIWDGQHRELLKEVPGIAASLAVTRDSRYVALGGDRKILIWKLK